MALVAGTVKNNGEFGESKSLAKALYEANEASQSGFKQPDENGVLSDADIKYNKKFSFVNQAKAQIDYFLENVEIDGVQTRVTGVNTNVNTQVTTAGSAAAQTGKGTGTGKQAGAAKGNQSNSGKGLVK